MNLTDHINPTAHQLENLVADYPEGTPVVMVNILRFKTHVAESDMTGENTYKRYAMNVITHLKNAGGRVLWRGEVKSTIIGDEEFTPDLIMLVKYPDVLSFINMISDPEYISLSKDRSISLEYGGLLACKEDLSFNK